MLWQMELVGSGVGAHAEGRTGVVATKRTAAMAIMLEMVGMVGGGGRLHGGEARRLHAYDYDPPYDMHVFTLRVSLQQSTVHRYMVHVRVWRMGRHA